MSQSGSQAAAFFREVADDRVVWYLRNDQGSPTSRTPAGERALPFWSSRARARRAAEVWAQDLQPASLSLETWRDEELPELADEGCRVGINWTGPRLVGWDLTVPEVLERLAHALRVGPYSVSG